MVDDEQARREDDGQSGDLRGASRLERCGIDKRLESPYEDKFGDDHGGPLEVDRLPTVIVEVVDLDHEGVDEAGDVGEDIFEVGKEGRVVEGPLRRLFKVPLIQGEALGDGEPIAVNFKVGGFAVFDEVVSSLPKA